MVKFTRDRSGRFTGSIGDGKSAVPTAGDVLRLPVWVDPPVDAPVTVTYPGTGEPAGRRLREAAWSAVTRNDVVQVRESVLRLWREGCLPHSTVGIEVMEASAEANAAADRLVANPHGVDGAAARADIAAAFDRMYLYVGYALNDRAPVEHRDGLAGLRVQVRDALDAVRKEQQAVRLGGPPKEFVMSRPQADWSVLTVPWRGGGDV